MNSNIVILAKTVPNGLPNASNREALGEVLVVPIVVCDGFKLVHIEKIDKK